MKQWDILIKVDSPQVKQGLISSLMNFVNDLPHELPNNLGIFADGGGLCAHTRKKKKK